jgi:hypothetical protein
VPVVLVRGDVVYQELVTRHVGLELQKKKTFEFEL